MTIKVSNIDELLQYFEEKYPLSSQRYRGTLFERVVLIYLQNEPRFRSLFENVWLLGDVSDEYGIPKRDTGVDLVAKRRDNYELVAIQAKYYSQETKIYKRHIDSFLNEVGKSYYSEGMVVASTDDWSDYSNISI